MIDITPGKSLTVDMSFAVPVDLLNPALVAISLLFPATEAAPAAPKSVFSSNGLELLFTR